MKNSLEPKLQTDYICSVRIFNILEVIAKMSSFKNQKMLNPDVSHGQRLARPITVCQPFSPTVGRANERQ